MPRKKVTIISPFGNIESQPYTKKDFDKGVSAKGIVTLDQMRNQQITELKRSQFTITKKTVSTVNGVTRTKFTGNIGKYKAVRVVTTKDGKLQDARTMTYYGKNATTIEGDNFRAEAIQSVIEFNRTRISAGFKRVHPKDFISTYLPEHYHESALRTYRAAEVWASKQEATYYDNVKGYAEISKWLGQPVEPDKPWWLDGQFRPAFDDFSDSSNLAFHRATVKQRAIENIFYASVDEDGFLRRGIGGDTMSLLSRNTSVGQLPTKQMFYDFLGYVMLQAYTNMVEMFPGAGTHEYGARSGGQRIVNTGHMRQSFVEPSLGVTRVKPPGSITGYNASNWSIRAMKEMATNPRTGYMYWDDLNDKDKVGFSRKPNKYKGFVKRTATWLSDQIKEYAWRHKYEPKWQDELEGPELDAYHEEQDKFATGLFEEAFGKDA